MEPDALEKTMSQLFCFLVEFDDLMINTYFLNKRKRLEFILEWCEKSLCSKELKNIHTQEEKTKFILLISEVKYTIKSKLNLFK